MPYPAFFQLTRGATNPTNSGEPGGSLNYWVFGCVQQRDANLKPMPLSARMRFAVMYREAIGDDLIETLAQVHDLGGLSPVKLIDVSENSLYIFLDACVSSSTVADIESMWLKGIGSGDYGYWTVHFASECEIWSGRSDYDFLSAAREVLESNTLGIMHDPSTTLGVHNSEKSWSDDPEMQSSLVQLLHAPLSPSAVKLFSSAALMSLGHQSHKMTEFYLRSSGRTKKQLRSFFKKLAQQMMSGLPIADATAHWPMEVSPYQKTCGDGFNKEMKKKMRHQARLSTVAYVSTLPAQGVCPNDFFVEAGD